jgi:virulence factor Mce-like protein
MSRLLRGATHEVMARLSALLLAGILVAAVAGFAVLHFGLLDSGPEYRAEFADAWPLVAGMDVRVSGAVAGSVRSVSLTKNGTAEVTFQLEPGVPQPRADASVAIRQDDLLGDSDLSLSLGTSPKRLRTPIAMARSIQAPRLDDFLNIFQQPVRTALKVFIVELGTAMQNRGVDVNSAILRLRPGFQALGDVLTELQSQIDALKRGVANSHAVTSQLARRTSDLDRLVAGLQQTAGGVAGRSAELDSGLAQLPAALSATRATLGQVHTLADSLKPLSQTVAEGAPGFQRTASLVAPYARALTVASKLAGPTVDLAGQALRHAGPAIAALNQTSFSNLVNPTGGLFSALAPLLGQLADGLFGSAGGGGGLGGVVLPGNDITAPNVDPARTYLSGYLVLTCEMFEVAQGPGCLSKALSIFVHPRSRAAPPGSTRAPAPARGNPAPSPSAGALTPKPVAPAPTTRPASAPAPPKPPTPGATATKTVTGSLKSLLNYLLGH